MNIIQTTIKKKEEFIVSSSITGGNNWRLDAHVNTQMMMKKNESVIFLFEEGWVQSFLTVIYGHSWSFFYWWKKKERERCTADAKNDHNDYWKWFDMHTFAIVSRLLLFFEYDLKFVITIKKITFDRWYFFFLVRKNNIFFLSIYLNE